MRMRVWSHVVGFALLLAFAPARGAIVITEIMYNPPQGSEYEYVEVHNTGGAPVDIGWWSFTQGITYTIPGGTQVPGGGSIVVCGSKTAFQSAYPGVPASSVFGPYAGNLANDGETLSLADGSSTVRETLTYGTDPPWELLADGFGASLERMCFSSSPDDPANWRASPVPPSSDQFGGSPGAPNAVETCPAAAPPRPRLRISEIMYHPVLEQDFEDNHEFIEIWNGEPAAVSIAGWRIAGAVDYTFAAGATIAAGGYAVIARKKTALAAEYGLNAGSLHGDYARTLDNGGEKVAIIGAGGQGIDSVTYDDDFPWPMGADALGADDDFLRAALLPLSNHQYRGHSLERVNLDIDSGVIANWAPSPLDAPTPGAANASARTVPLPIVEDLLASPVSSPGPLIRSGDQVLIQARFAPAAPSGTVDLQYFVDDVSVTNETITTVAMKDDGTGGDLISGDLIYSVTLPARPNNSIVRHRVRADLEPGGTGIEVVSPRPTDPNDWHAYFVSPVINTTTRVYQLFISPGNWTQLWDNIQNGRVSGCNESPSWDAKLPAVFVYNGRVVDARVRYQGSRYNRSNGPNLSSWPFPGPTRPSPVRALSWRVALPRYGQLDGSAVITLNKLTQGCPGYDAGVGYQLFAMADIPAPTTRFVRFHINGGYYHYMIQYEHPDEDMMRRYHREQAEKYPGDPRETEVGHLFKSVGCNCDEGPFGWGDARRLVASCGHTDLFRYSRTYDRKTYAWDSHVAFKKLIDDLHAARSSLPNTTALRTYFEQNFDLDLLLSYVVIFNWSVPFDDMFQNHFYYQRRSDGKWLMTPWDLDLNFGGWLGSDASLYMGEQGDPDNRSGWWHYIKDALMKSYRAEYENRLLELTNSILSPSSVHPLVDAVRASANPTEANQAPAGVQCDFTSEANAFKSFVSSRINVVNSALSSVSANAGPDQTVLEGARVQFDARASRPDPGGGVTYAWSNGMTGDFPTFTYDTPGTYVVTLTITVSGTPYRDSVTLTVVTAPSEACREVGGQVVIEAESFYINDPHGATAASWAADTAQAGYSGASYMEAKDTVYTRYTTDYGSTAPELRYAVLFATTGTYRVWVRGFSALSDYDSVHVGLDGDARDESFAQRFNVDAANYLWSGDTRGQGPQQLTVSTPGVHFLSLWIRESGQIVDKVILTTNTGFTPTGLGPAASEKVPISSNPSFIRADANGDAVVDLSDALAVLFFLFRGSSSLDCEDHGDFDDNGTLQVTDAVGILDYLFRGGAAPRAPFPTAGKDTTADGYDCGDC